MDRQAMSICYFHDLPVYRLSDDSYDKEADRTVDGLLASLRSASVPYPPSVLEKMARQMRDDHLEKYGPWLFNEIVSFVRLHFLGSQVRGEYFGQKRKRHGLTRNKVFHYQTCKLAPEVDIPFESNNGQILAKILEYIDDCRAELPTRFFDDAWLREVGPFVNWRGLRNAKDPW
jgi:hypothetical protein